MADLHVQGVTLAPERLRLLRRFSLSTGNQTVNAALSTTAQVVVGPSLVLPTLEPRQAARLIWALCGVSDAGGTHMLTAVSAALIFAAANAPLNNQNLKQLRVWQCNYSPVLLGQLGIRFGVVDDEFFYGTDYLEYLTPAGSSPGAFNLNVQADVTNASAGALPVTFVITILMEIYQLDVGVG